jgi:transcriptional regulator with GAF, ATPase, and Fis domain
MIHSLDRRPDKRELVVLDCTTIVPELSGSEFFGHERGAYTGADRARDGAFALADRGTLFLDEIGELPMKLQAQLLRVVQEQTFKRVGGNGWLPSRFRLVCATNRDLYAEVAAGRFRADLYYRLASIVCRLPPLHDRAEDVLPLFRRFWGDLHPSGDDVPVLTEPVRQLLVCRQYPGNVRELRQLTARMAYRHVGTGPITLGDVPEDERGAAPLSTDWPDADFLNSVRRAMVRGIGLKEITRAASETAIRIAMTEERGNLHQAALKLGVTDRALQLRKAHDRRNAGQWSYEPTTTRPKRNETQGIDASPSQGSAFGAPSASK